MATAYGCGGSSTVSSKTPLFCLWLWLKSLVAFSSFSMLSFPEVSNCTRPLQLSEVVICLRAQAVKKWWSWKLRLYQKKSSLSLQKISRNGCNTVPPWLRICGMLLITSAPLIPIGTVPTMDVGLVVGPPWYSLQCCHLHELVNVLVAITVNGNTLGVRKEVIHMDLFMLFFLLEHHPSCQFEIKPG